MAQKRVNISIDSELNDRWAEISKKHGITKSGMVEEYLREVLPILEQERPKDTLRMALKKAAEGIDRTASLFE